MAPIALINARIELNSAVISTSVKKVTLPFESEELDTTTFGGSGWKSSIGGLKSASVSLDLVNDFAAAALDATTWALFNTVVTCKVRTDSGSISTSNPEWAGSVLVNKWTPYDNAVGSLTETSVDWPATGAWARATS
jgi:hypothetical protein